MAGKYDPILGEYRELDPPGSGTLAIGSAVGSGTPHRVLTIDAAGDLTDTKLFSDDVLIDLGGGLELTGQAFGHVGVDGIDLGFIDATAVGGNHVFAIRMFTGVSSTFSVTNIDTFQNYLVMNKDVSDEITFQIVPDGTNQMLGVFAGGVQIGTGAVVTTIETTLTNDDTKLPTSGAVFDAIAAAGGAVTSVNTQTGAVVLELDDIDDVDTTGVADGDVLTYDTGSSEWIAAAPAGGGLTIADFIDSDSIDFRTAGEAGTNHIMGPTVDSGSNISSGSSRKRVSPMTADQDGELDTGHIRLWVSASTQKVRMVVYSDNAGVPDALLATSDEVTISNTSEAEIDFTFSGLDRIIMTNGTTYHIGFHNESNSNTLFVSYDAVTSNGNHTNSDTYAGGATNPFGAPTTATGLLDAYVTVLDMTLLSADVIPPGSDTQMLYNDGGELGAAQYWVYNDTTGGLKGRPITEITSGSSNQDVFSVTDDDDYPAMSINNSFGGGAIYYAGKFGMFNYVAGGTKHYMYEQDLTTGYHTFRGLSASARTSTISLVGDSGNIQRIIANDLRIQPSAAITMEALAINFNASIGAGHGTFQIKLNSGTAMFMDGSNNKRRIAVGNSISASVASKQFHVTSSDAAYSAITAKAFNTSTSVPILEVLNSADVELMGVGRLAMVVNETGLDYDFRVEGDTDANLLMVDASVDRVGIGESAPDYKLDVNGPIGFTPGASVTPVDNGDVVFEFTNDTTLTIKGKGSDGVVRTATVTLA